MAADANRPPWAQAFHLACLSTGYDGAGRPCEYCVRAALAAKDAELADARESNAELPRKEAEARTLLGARPDETVPEAVRRVLAERDAAILAEREACAAECEGLSSFHIAESDAHRAAQRCADRIRSRR